MSRRREVHEWLALWYNYATRMERRAGTAGALHGWLDAGKDFG